MNEKPIVDASGQWLNVGDVITHVNRSGSSLCLTVGYITEVNKAERYIKWIRVVEEWTRGGSTCSFAAKPTRIDMFRYCTKTGMTIERLKSKYGIQEGEQELERPETEPMGTRFSTPHTLLCMEGEAEIRGNQNNQPLGEEVPD